MTSCFVNQRHYDQIFRAKSLGIWLNFLEVLTYFFRSFYLFQANTTVLIIFITVRGLTTLCGYDFFFCEDSKGGQGYKVKKFKIYSRKFVVAL